MLDCHNPRLRGSGLMKLVNTVERDLIWAHMSSHCRNAGRQKDSCWVVLSTPKWASQAASHLRKPVPNITDGPDQIPESTIKLLSEFEKVMEPLVGGQLPKPKFLNAQMWGAAFKASCLPESCLFDPDIDLAACGDFCLESSAVGAIESGLAAAAAVQTHLDNRVDVARH